MTHFICPVCKEPLILQERTYRCENNHCFDCAKSGYVNLLRSQRSSDKRHGDDKLMIRARTAFLEKGFYTPLLQKLTEQCLSHADKFVHLCDIGCGEGWYTNAIFQSLRAAGRVVQMEGIDISKDALTVCAKRNPYIAASVASISALPIESESVDILLNLFAPDEPREFARVIKKGGLWLKVIPLERHLYGLKEAIYEKPYLNEVSIGEYEDFVLTERIEIKENMVLENTEDIENLFRMTPYYYKTSARDQAKVMNLKNLETPIEFAILVYKKRESI